MKLEAPPRTRHHDDDQSQMEHILDIGQLQNADIESLLEKYQNQLVGTMESINRETEEVRVVAQVTRLILMMNSWQRWREYP
jgi:hypothetical protein